MQAYSKKIDYLKQMNPLVVPVTGVKFKSAFPYA